MKKPGRNDLCPCGSGKKYKQCCLPSELPTTALQNDVAALSAADVDRLALLYKLGHHLDVENKARALIEQHPTSGFVWKALGASLRAQGKDAMHALQMAVKLLPNDAETINNFGNELKDQGRLNDAVASYRRALEINPELVEALGNLGNALRDLGDLDQAAATLRRALELRPDFAKAHYNLGNTLREMGRVDDAVTSYRRTLEIEPNLVEAHCNLGNALRDMGQLDDAIVCYRQALKIKPNYVDAYCNMGVTLREQGLLDEASRSFESAITLNSNSIDAHFNLSLLKSYRLGDPHLAMLEKQLARIEEVPANTRVRFWFALGKIREDLGHYDESFTAYSEGNRLQRVSLTRDEAAEDALINRMMSIFSKEFFAARNLQNSADKAPIFIVGMPRSGTSLLEQILSTCAGVYGAGELTTMREVVTAAMPGAAAERFPDAVTGLSPDNFKHMGEDYAERIWRNAPEAFHIIDKMPANFFYLGMIHLMLPKAKIVHAMRDPMDSCFSCYSHLFAERNQGFTYDLESLGRYYARYSKLMQHLSLIHI